MYWNITADDLLKWVYIKDLNNLGKFWIWTLLSWLLLYTGKKNDRLTHSRQIWVVK